jgi:hypothetical protein
VLSPFLREHLSALLLRLAADVPSDADDAGDTPALSSV